MDIRLRHWVAMLLVFGSSASAASESPRQPVLFPRPPELIPAVDFWKRVFAAYGTDQGILHDSVDLSVVYGVEWLGGRADGGRDRERSQSQKAILSRYRAVLKRYAEGRVDVSRASGDELRVWLALGRTTDRDRYRRAAENIRIQVGQRDRFERGLAASRPHLEGMKEILRTHGLPESLAVIPFIESAFNPRASSKAGAVGLWQIIRSTGRRFLKINRRVDERRDPRKATVAAARILKENYELLGNWPLAITAYNHGPGGMARAVRTMGSSDIVAIIRGYKGKAFGFASRNFYPEFLAALDVIPRSSVYFGGLSALSVPEEPVPERDREPSRQPHLHPSRGPHADR